MEKKAFSQTNILRHIVCLIFLAVFVACLLLLSSCGYRGYSGKHSDLYSVAIHSVPWTNGFSWGADFECDPQIRIIEEDHYGRTMFTYYEKYYKGADVSFSTLIICQYSNEEEVYYYEDINYIVKEQSLYSPNPNEFSDEEIEYLKSINDWNKEINYDKCVRKEIAKEKKKLSNEKEIKRLIIDELALVDGEDALFFMDYLTSSADESKYIVYGNIRKDEKSRILFIGLVEDGEDTKINVFIPSNVYDYQAELVEFKKSNHWYQRL